MDNYDAAVASLLESLAERIESADRLGALDIEAQTGILTITHDSGKTLVISRHAPSKQVWLASPISGGLHFMPDKNFTSWQLADGRRLEEVLTQELAAIAKLNVNL